MKRPNTRTRLALTRRHPTLPATAAAAQDTAGCCPHGVPHGVEEQPLEAAPVSSNNRKTRSQEGTRHVHVTINACKVS